MEKVSIHGRMEDSMMANINLIKNTDSVCIHGLMEEDMKDYGLMENRMEEVNTIYPMEL